MPTNNFLCRRAAIVAMLLCLSSGFGCKQMSHGVRSEPVSEGSPIPPSPELQPVPQTASPFLPPPAPPTDSARLESSDDFWSRPDSEVSALEDTEFFPDLTPSLPPAFSRQRAENAAGRLADEARLAAARRDWERQHLLPIIVPATPSLMRVSGEAPVLLPVPKTK